MNYGFILWTRDSAAAVFQLMFWLTFYVFYWIFNLLGLHERWRNSSVITKHTSQLQSVWCQITKRWICREFSLKWMCFFYKNHYSLLDTYQLLYTGDLAGNRNLSFNYETNFYVTFILWM